MKIVLITSQGGTFWDVAKSGHRPMTRINQSDPGSLGRHCNSRGSPLPSELDIDGFGPWCGPAREVLAGPVIEVTRFEEFLGRRGHVTEIWYLTSGLGWIEGGTIYHPLWTSNLEWQGEEPPGKLIAAVEKADAVITALPTSIIFENSFLRALLSEHRNVAVATGGTAHEVVTLGRDGLRLRTRGVARLGKANRSKILKWLRNESC